MQHSTIPVGHIFDPGQSMGFHMSLRYICTLTLCLKIPKPDFLCMTLEKSGIWKCQVVLLLDGMISSLFLSSIRHNDNGLVNLSGLNEYLTTILAPIHQYVFPALYCDAIYGLLPTLVRRYQNPTPQQRIVNRRMSSMRILIEDAFIDLIAQFFKSSYYLCSQVTVTINCV